MATSGAAKRCIVTGGSSGIGAAICLALGRKGHSVFVTGTIPQQGRNREAAEGVAGRVRDAGGRGAAGVGDVCSAADVERLAGEAKEGCDVLVTSAGIG
ncbi:hypothetical protein T484DRAFT_1823053, partial [Baffinella frigidus]